MHVHVFPRPLFSLVVMVGLSKAYGGGGTLHQFFFLYYLVCLPQTISPNEPSGDLDPGRIGDSFFKSSSKDSIGIIQVLGSGLTSKRKEPFGLEAKTQRSVAALIGTQVSMSEALLGPRPCLPSPSSSRPYWDLLLSFQALWALMGFLDLLVAVIMPAKKAVQMLLCLFHRWRD